MREAKEIAGKKCPNCGRTEKQVNTGKNRSGTQRCFCNECKKLHHRPENARVPRRNPAAGNKDILRRSKRTRSRKGVWL